MDKNNKKYHPKCWGIVTVVAIIVLSFFALLFYKIVIDPIFNIKTNFDIAAKIVVGVSGLIASFFLVYRSVLNAQQTNEQTKQGERTERQLKITAEQIELSRTQLQETKINNLAKLLVDAASLVSREKTSDIKTGLTILNYIGNAENSPFVHEAIAIIRDYFFSSDSIIDDENESHSTYIRALTYLDKIGKKNNITIPMNNIFIKLSKTIKPFKFLYEIAYIDCLFMNIDFTKQKENTFINCSFRTCTISHNCCISNMIVPGADVSRHTRFYDCNITSLSFNQLRNNFYLVASECNFTGFSAKIYNSSDIPFEEEQSVSFLEKNVVFVISNCTYETTKHQHAVWVNYLNKLGVKAID